MTFSDGGRRSPGEPLRLPMIGATGGVARMPATRGDCVGDGICPVLRCKHNLALHITAAGTITSGACGGTGSGMSLPIKRKSTGKMRRLDDMTSLLAELVVALADRVPSICALDYADRGGMSIAEIGKLLGSSRQGASAAIDKIIAKLQRNPEAMAVLREWASR